MKQQIECVFYLGNDFYECFVSEKCIQKDAELEFIGKHVDEMTNENVTRINFLECVMMSIPQKLTTTFPNLENLSIMFAHLQQITREELNEYSHFKVLSFDHNDIEFLPGDLFKNMRNLQEVSFYQNKIILIEENFLDNLEQQLKKVELRNNICIDRCYASHLKLGGQYVKIEDLKEEIRKKFSSSLLIKKIKMEKTGLFNDLNKLIKNEKFEDFTIIVGDEKFKVHKFLLSARSPALAYMIQSSGTTQCLNLTNVTANCFREILNFMYTDQLPKRDDINFVELLDTSGNLQIENLKNFAAEKLLDKVNSENALEIFKLCSKYENENLRRKSFEEIKIIIGDYFEIDESFIDQHEKIKKALDIKKDADSQIEKIKEATKNSMETLFK